MRLLDVVERRGRDLGRDRQGLVRGLVLVLVLVLGRRYAADYAGDRNNRYCLAVPAADLVDHARQLKVLAVNAAQCWPAGRA